MTETVIVKGTNEVLEVETPGFHEPQAIDPQNCVMVDLETLGLSPRAAILSIGCLQFDPRGGDGFKFFYATVREDSQPHRERDPKTVEWWKTQPDKVRDVLQDPDALSIGEALTRLSAWFPPGATIWGNGSDFDVAKLDDAYKFDLNQPSPWEFHNVRCYRTLKSLPGADKAAKPVRVDHHNAIADALYQAQHMQAIYQTLGWGYAKDR